MNWNLAVPAWQGAICEAEKQDLERIQKSAFHIISGITTSFTKMHYKHYIETQEDRRLKLTLKFGLKAEKHQKFQKWFKPNVKSHNTRHYVPKYCPVRANHARFAQSALSYLTGMLMYTKA